MFRVMCGFYRYTAESAELQTRKLGDLYFMFGHYNLAFQVRVETYYYLKNNLTSWALGISSSQARF